MWVFPEAAFKNLNKNRLSLQERRVLELKAALLEHGHDVGLLVCGDDTVRLGHLAFVRLAELAASALSNNEGED